MLSAQNTIPAYVIKCTSIKHSIILYGIVYSVHNITIDAIHCILVYTIHRIYRECQCRDRMYVTTTPCLAVPYAVASQANTR